MDTEFKVGDECELIKDCTASYPELIAGLRFIITSIEHINEVATGIINGKSIKFWTGVLKKVETTNEIKKCICSTRQLMISGCQCGGI